MNAAHSLVPALRELPVPSLQAVFCEPVVVH